MKIAHKMNKNKLIKIQFLGANYLVSLQHKHETRVANTIEIPFKTNCQVHNRFSMMFKHKKHTLDIDVCSLACTPTTDQDMVPCC